MTDARTVRLVIVFLGAAALMLGAGMVWLVHSAIAKRTVDGQAVALIAAVSTLAGSALTGLASVLVSTHSAPADQPIPVAGPDGGPVPVEDVGP